MKNMYTNMDEIRGLALASRHEDHAEKKKKRAKVVFNTFQRRLSISVYGTIFVILIIFEC